VGDGARAVAPRRGRPQVQVCTFCAPLGVWAAGTQRSGSKFIHGCATLLPNRVDLVPFWLPQSTLHDIHSTYGRAAY
jgi:hypothetical protein